MANKTYKRNVYSLKIKLKGIVENQVCINKGLVTKYGGGGGLQTGRGRGVCEVLPLRKGGVETVLGGHKKFFFFFFFL